VSLQDLVQGWAARGFADFPGLAIDGSIPLKQELLNDLIGQALSSAAGGATSAGPPPDLVAALRPLLKKVEVTASEGVVTLHFQVRA
jgi:hypothetical protein